jgi:hypothetical protein
MGDAKRKQHCKVETGRIRPHHLGDIHCDILVCIGKGKMSKKSESGFRVGDKIRVSMHGGKIVDAVINWRR